MFRKLFNMVVEPIDENDVLIPEDLSEIPLDEYDGHDVGDVPNVPPEAPNGSQA
jgi:hypothetical protein